MIWIGSFNSLQTVIGKHRFTDAPLDVHTWVRSEIALISPLVDWLVNLIATPHVCGEEQLVQLALREALSNAMLHGNRLEAGKLVHVHCCCEPHREVFVVVSDQGRGFDPNQIPNSLAVQNPRAEHPPWTHFITPAMGETSFEHTGNESPIRT